METLVPKLDTLPSHQRLLWNKLGETPPCFVLYGGTALALRLGHRESIDFDFFTSEPFQPLRLLESIGYLRNQRATQQAENTLSCNVETADGPVQVSFFGGLALRQIEAPDLAEGNEIKVASLLDVFGTKCVTVVQRNEIKDYLDIHALLTKTPWTLADGLAAARAIYGNQYDPIVTLQALSYFDDLSGMLPDRTKADLRGAASTVSLGDLPKIEASSGIGSAGSVP